MCHIIRIYICMYIYIYIRIYLYVFIHTYISIYICVNESHVKYECVTSYVNESCHTWIRHITCEWVKWHIPAQRHPFPSNYAIFWLSLSSSHVYPAQILLPKAFKKKFPERMNKAIEWFLYISNFEVLALWSDEPPSLRGVFISGGLISRAGRNRFQRNNRY